MRSGRAGLPQLAFACAMEEDWEGALAVASAFLDHRPEYGFARERLRLLQNRENPSAR